MFSGTDTTLTVTLSTWNGPDPPFPLPHSPCCPCVVFHKRRGHGAGVRGEDSAGTRQGTIEGGKCLRCQTSQEEARSSRFPKHHESWLTTYSCSDKHTVYNQKGIDCLSIRLPACVALSEDLFDSLSLSIYIYISRLLLSVCLSLSVCLCLSVCLSVRPSISVYLYIYMLKRH